MPKVEIDNIVKRISITQENPCGASIKGPLPYCSGILCFCMIGLDHITKFTSYPNFTLTSVDALSLGWENQ